MALSPPPLPPNIPGKMLGLSSPAMAPGASGSLTVNFSNPFSESIVSVALSLGVYAWTALDNSSSGPVGPSDSWTPGISLNGSPASKSVSWTENAVASGDHQTFSVAVQVPSGCPQGTYFLRSSLNLTLSNGTRYVMLSRGFFSGALWQKATLGPGGHPILNLTLLNVSGVSPETSIVVVADTAAPWLWLFLGAALVLAGAGGFLWVRSERQAAKTSGASPWRRRK